MNAKVKDENVDLLFQAILALQNMEECYDFFEDLCTVPELKAMSQRLVVAKMPVSYTHLKEQRKLVCFSEKMWYNARSFVRKGERRIAKRTGMAQKRRGPGFKGWRPLGV